MEKQLGRISSVSFGMGGYQEAQFGLSLTFEFKGSGVGTFIAGGWSFPPDKHAKWTEEDRIKSMGEMAIKVCELLKTAKVSDVQRMKGIPIEATFENFTLKEWRILEEAL